MQFKDYPDITIPQCLIDLKFNDESWRDDSAARATLKLPNGAILVAWVDYAEEDKREMYGARFGIQLMVSEDSYGIGEQNLSVKDTDDEAEFEATILKLISCFAEVSDM